MPSKKKYICQKKPRIKIAGYYHIINKEVGQRDIFIKTEDYPYSTVHYFLKGNNLPTYKDGYSQHLIAKVLYLSQPAISGIIKRNI